MSTKGKPKRKTKKQIQRQQELIRFSSCIVIIGLGFIAMLRLGVVGVFLDQIMRVLLGEWSVIYHGLIISVAIMALINPKSFKKSWRFWVGVGFIFVAWILSVNLFLLPQTSGMIVFSDYLKMVPEVYANASADAYAGIIGSFLFGVLSYLLDRGGVLVFIIVSSLLGIALIVTPRKMFESAQKGTEATKSSLEKIKEKRASKKLEQESASEETVNELESMIDSNYDSRDAKANFISMDPTEELHSASVSNPFMTLDETVENKVAEHEDDSNDGVESADLSSDENPFGFENAGLDPILTNIKTVTQETVSKGPDIRPTTYENYKVPSINNLERSSGTNRSVANDQSAKEKSQRLLSVLKQFGIEATLIDIHIGPAVTKFELKPDSNVKISKISSIQDNLMMELAVKTLRIEAPIPGKSAVGIEIPNVEMMPVKMKDVISKSSTFAHNDNVQVALGKDLMGKPITVSLNKMPHLLVAGATGSGKSVCMNTIITSILLTKTPDELKLLLIDPKKVEFTPYTEIPHLIGPVISDPHQASLALKVVVEEMDQRYDLFSKAGVRNIGSYNEKIKEYPSEGHKKMPWIVVIIDELADLMAVAGKEVETSIQRITQLARAAGIHLIVATQRPSVDVVTGIIKANIPSRIAFAVSSAIDSRTILDATGAEKLLGYGDMLYIPMGEPNAISVQGCYVSDDEVRAIAEKASSQAAPSYDDAFIKLDVDGNQGIVDGSNDPKYKEALEFVVMNQKASTSLLQRRLGIGYNRAANIIDELYQNGVIGPAQGSKPRDVFKKPEDIQDNESSF